MDSGHKIKRNFKLAACGVKRRDIKMNIRVSKMIIGYVLLELLFASCYLGSSLTDSREEASEVRIPFTEKVLNSVLGRLERSRQERLETVSALEKQLDCNDADMLPEYTESVQGSSARERDVRHLASQKHFPICHLERKIRRLNTNEFEYRPAYYEEVLCVPRSLEYEVTSEICSSLGFSCIQWNKTIHLTRRRYSSECWETKTMVIPAGCECMWPVHKLGDMKLHTKKSLLY